MSEVAVGTRMKECASVTRRDHVGCNRLTITTGALRAKVDRCSSPFLPNLETPPELAETLSQFARP